MDLTGNKVTVSGDSDAPVPAVGGGRTHQVSTSIEYASNAGVLRQAPAANHGVGTATAGSGGDQATSAGEIAGRSLATDCLEIGTDLYAATPPERSATTLTFQSTKTFFSSKTFKKKINLSISHSDRNNRFSYNSKNRKTQIFYPSNKLHPDNNKGITKLPDTKLKVHHIDSTFQLKSLEVKEIHFKSSHPDKMNTKQVRPNNVLKKNWDKRYSLFNKYDRGIQLDAESFYSVCPEILSYHIAQRCKGKVAMDPFCGAGGNIIQLARFYTKVIAIDKDPEKIKMAIHNSKIYGVEKHIIFIVGDFFKLANQFKADVIVTSPPWGGPNYSKKKNYTLRNMCQEQGHDGFEIFELARKIAPNIVLHLPKNIYLGECQSLANSINDQLQIEKNFINNKLDSISAFFGDFY